VTASELAGKTGGPSAANAFLTAFSEHPHHPKIHLDQHHPGPIQPSDLRPILPIAAARGATLVNEHVGKRVRAFRYASTRGAALSVAGSEHLGLPEVFSQVQH
jgi:hypothetical protein